MINRDRVRTNFEVTARIKVEILWLYVPMSNTLAMEIRYAGDNLLEAALDLGRAHATFLDGSIQIASGTEFHYFTPIMILVLDEIHSFDDVRVVKRGRNAKLGRKLLNILLFGFILASLSEFLDIELHIRNDAQ